MHKVYSSEEHNHKAKCQQQTAVGLKSDNKLKIASLAKRCISLLCKDKLCLSIIAKIASNLCLIREDSSNLL